MKQPDLMAPANGLRLASLEALSQELGVPLFQTRDFLTGLNVPWIKIGRKDYVNLAALELEIWARTRGGTWKVPDTIGEAISAYTKAGLLYAGMSYESVRQRLKNVAAPLARGPTKVRLGGRLAQEDPRFVGDKTKNKTEETRPAAIPAAPEETPTGVRRCGLSRTSTKDA